MSKDLALGRMPPRAMKAWETYLEISLQRLKLERPEPKALVNILQDSEYQRHDAKIAAYWALRAVLSPVIEGLILLDRQSGPVWRCFRHNLTILLIFWQGHLSPRVGRILGVAYSCFSTSHLASQFRNSGNQGTDRVGWARAASGPFVTVTVGLAVLCWVPAWRGLLL